MLGEGHGGTGSRAIEFRVLGQLQAYEHGAEIPLGAPKQRVLLVELLLARGALVPRGRLIDAIWDDAPPESAASALQVYVHGLRRVLGRERIETHGAGYRLRLEAGELDLERFDALVEQGRADLEVGAAADAAGALRAALELWRGPALADLHGAQMARRTAELEERKARTQELRNDAELALGRHDELLDELGQQIAEHPLRERLREQQILALYRAGRQADALDAYRETRRVLVDELGIEPGPGLHELERAVLRHDPALSLPTGAPVAAPPLPASPTPLVGRRLETAAVAALLRRSDVRLVTLTGPGGTGKTRLALAAAEELASEFPGGALFVDLSTVHDPALVAAAVAHALGVGAGDADVMPAVVAALAARDLLLVLDNLEQLLPDASFVARLLSAAPRLRVLATSRSPLRLTGEYEYPVPPLPVTAPGAPFDQVAANDAVRLFMERVAATGRGFALDDGTAETVAAICRRLDGLPLALELAAAWARVLGPDGIERRLGRALDLLVRGARDLPPRQQTLRATLDWSYELLDADAREAMARLSVFVGGCAVEAAETVLGDTGALARLTGLVESSVLRFVDTGGGRRFVQLETVREYALERLRDGHDEHEIRRRHAGHFLALAERLGAELAAGASEDVLAVLDLEHENLLAALEWAADAGEVETEVRLAAALRPYWSLRGELAQARRAFERAIAHSESGPPALHATALVHGAVFAYRRGDTGTALSEWERALALFRALGDDGEVARCTGELGSVAMAEGDLDRAEELWREAAAAFAAGGNRLREALVVANLAAVAAERGLHHAAVAEGERALAMQRELDDREGICVSVHNLSRWRLALGETQAAGALTAEALALGAELGYREILATALGVAGDIALQHGDPERAVQLLAAGDAVVAAMGLARGSDEQQSCDRALAASRARLGEERFQRLYETGAALPLSSAVAEAQAAIF